MKSGTIRVLMLTHFFPVKYLKIWKTLIITTVIPPRFISIETLRATYFIQPWLIRAKDMVERRLELFLGRFENTRSKCFSYLTLLKTVLVVFVIISVHEKRGRLGQLDCLC